MNRVNVGVHCRVDTEGVVSPLKVMWEDGRVWDIERVLHTCRSPDMSFVGIRYTVLIEGMEKYLYRSDQQWYVLVS